MFKAMFKTKLKKKSNSVFGKKRIPRSAILSEESNPGEKRSIFKNKRYYEDAIYDKYVEQPKRGWIYLIFSALLLFAYASVSEASYVPDLYSDKRMMLVPLSLSR